MSLRLERDQQALSYSQTKPSPVPDAQGVRQTTARIQPHIFGRNVKRKPPFGEEGGNWQENVLRMDAPLYQLCLGIFKSFILTSHLTSEFLERSGNRPMIT